MAVNPENRKSILQALGCLFGVIFLPLVICALLFILPIRIERATFCSTNNEIYRLIEDNAEEWVEDFKSITDPVIPFYAPNGKTYVAVTSSFLEGRDYFYVVIERSRSDAMGYWGFIYQPLYTPENGYYQYEYLKAGIYCYWRD